MVAEAAVEAPAVRACLDPPSSSPSPQIASLAPAAGASTPLDRSPSSDSVVPLFEIKCEPVEPGGDSRPLEPRQFYPLPAPDLDSTLTAALAPVAHFPLDFFDDPNPPRAPWTTPPDHSLHLPAWPAQRIDGPNATSQYQLSDSPTWTREWLACTVLSYDLSTKRLLIQWHHAPAERKWVTRLNLRFDAEDPVHFDLRRAAAWQQHHAWIEHVETWHAVASICSDAPRLPAEFESRFLQRLATSPWRGRRPDDEAWEPSLQAYRWHWSFASKQHLLHGATPDDSTAIDERTLWLQNLRKDCPLGNMLRPDECVVARPRAWSALAQIRASLVRVIDEYIAFPDLHARADHSPVCRRATSPSSTSSSTPALLPVERVYERVSAHLTCLDHALKSEWRAGAMRALSVIPCLGHVYTRLLRLADCIVDTEFRRLIEGFHAHLSDFFLNRLDRGDVAAPTAAMSIELVLDEYGQLAFSPPLDMVNQLFSEMIHSTAGFLSDWRPFHASKDAEASSSLPVPSADTVLAAAARGYRRCNVLLDEIQQWLWLLESPSSAADSISGIATLDRVDQRLASLMAVRERLFSMDSLVPVADSPFAVRVGQVVRQLRGCWRDWHAHVLAELVHVFETGSQQLASVAQSTVADLSSPSIGADPKEWSALAAALASRPAVLADVKSTTAVLQRWWDVCYAHEIELTDDQSRAYWTVVRTHRQLVCEYEVADESLQRARADYVARLAVLTDHISLSLHAHFAELAELAQERHAKAAPNMGRRVGALAARVTRLEQDIATATALQTHLHVGTFDGDPTPKEWPEIRDLKAAVARRERLWNTAITIQTTLHDWKHMFFMTLPRDAIGPTLCRWREELRQLSAIFGADDAAPDVVAAVYAEAAVLGIHWPVLYALSSPYLQMRHWFQVTKRTGLAAHDLELLTLEQVLAAKLDLLVDVLLVGTGPHRLASWDSWDVPLSEQPHPASKDLPSSGGSLSSTLALAAGPQPPQHLTGQDALAIILKANSMHFEANPAGPGLWPAAVTVGSAATANAKRTTATVPLSRITGIQVRPVDAQRYLHRELEWLAWSGSRTLRRFGAEASYYSGGGSGSSVMDEDDEVGEIGASEDDLSVRPGSDATFVTAPSAAAIPSIVEHHAPLPAVSVVCGASAVRRGIWHTRLGNVFYYLACSNEESMGEPLLEAQLMAQSAVAIYLSPVDGEAPLAKLVVSVPRGMTPEVFCSRVEAACGRPILIE
ncbi:hypothetical protein H9P43_001398 [Blastocladiella emersonii ATCC 22665]|nr:hypothetical protein H9P43_001398 [Blastocladiella emersonii ATCC 22665]